VSGILRQWGDGLWRSLAARLLWEQEVVGSNPTSPTMTRNHFLLTGQLADYVDAHSPQPTELEQRLIDETGKLAEWEMQIAFGQAAFLRFLIEVSGAERILEIGTFTGYSSLAMAQALPETGSIVALDVSEEWTAVARRYWKEAGVEDMIDLRIGPAAESLRAMPEEPVFDLAFIDADKTGYPEYWELVVPRVRSGGIIVADNTLRRGRVADPSETSEHIDAVRRFNDAAAGDDRVASMLLPVFDGMTIAVKR
jgi:predicted O-methyltransferase YrrM